MVLECDGTPIDESDVLCLLNKGDIIILLTPGELWIKDIDVILSDTLSPTSSNFGSNLSEELSFGTSPGNNETYLHSAAVEQSPSKEFTEMHSATVVQTPLKELRVNTNTILPPRLVNEELWWNLDLRWEDLSKQARDDLEKGRTVWREVVHLVVNRMREISKYLPRNAIKIVARRIIQKYPQFTDKINDEVVGCGYYQIYLKIQDHNNYLNRNEKSPPPLKEVKIPIRHRKIMANKMSGRPKINIETVSVNINEKKKQLETFIFKQDNSPELFKILDEVYPTIQEFIDSNPSFENYFNEWPIIFTESVTYWLYSKIMGHSIKNLTNALKCETNKQKIIKYAQIKNITDSGDNSNDEILYMIELIAKLFKENLNDFYKMHEVRNKLSY